MYSSISICLFFLCSTNALLLDRDHDNCEDPITLNSSLDNALVCGELLHSKSDCNGTEVIEIITRVIPGKIDFIGWYTSGAILKTKCDSSPMGFVKSVERSYTLFYPSEKDKAELPLMDSNNIIYPQENCDWNLFSSTSIISEKRIMIDRQIIGYIYPFQNIVQVENEKCDLITPETKKSPSLKAKCTNGWWEGNISPENFARRIISEDSFYVCHKDGFFIEKETGVVIGSDKVCITHLAGVPFFLTSDHLLLDIHDSIDIKNIPDCAFKSGELYSIDKDNLLEKIDEAKYQANLDGSLFCDVMVKIKPNPMSSVVKKMISKINSVEKIKPGKFLQVEYNETKDLSAKWCYHTSAKDTVRLKTLNYTRSELTKDLFKIVIKEHLETKETYFEDTSFKPDKIIRDSPISTILLILSIIGLIFLIYKFYPVCYNTWCNKRRGSDPTEIPMTERAKSKRRNQGEDPYLDIFRNV